METFDYRASAELYPPKTGSHACLIGHLQFARAADAIRYAIEHLSPEEFLATFLKVGEERFNDQEIRQLYDDAKYPLKRSSTGSMPRLSS